MYKFGSAARTGAPPISLQAVWTADNGRLPPWKGDFHHDLNTQLSYWPAYSSNHLDLETPYLDWLWEITPEAKHYTKAYFGTSGLNVPGVTTLRGAPMGGWIQYSFSPTVSAWLGQHFYLHWRYSMDRNFLAEKAYPWLRDVAAHLDELSVKDTAGRRKLPLSSSPEIRDNSLDAWYTSLTNYDLALIRWTYQAASELAAELDLTEDSQKWKKILSEWPDLAISGIDNSLVVAPGEPPAESHRHFSHLMAIHPLGLIDWSNGLKDQKIIINSLARLEKLGTDQWCGYSYSWLGNMKARARDGEGAARALRIFADCFCLPNSFHANGDQSGTGKSKYTYRPFTLEGNFAFAAGVQEMLLQSHAGVIELFPAVPGSWKNAGFRNLRAVGAFLITAELKAGRVGNIRIYSEKGARLRLRNPFGGTPFQLNGVAMISKEEIIDIVTYPGQTIILGLL
jgi:alpha-L-fucosidase 2